MTGEHIINALQNVSDEFILEAAPVTKENHIRKRKITAIVCAAVLALLLVSCGVAVVAGDVLREWFSSYNLEQYSGRMTQDEIEYICSAENFSLVYYSGMGPNLVLYQYEYNDEKIQVAASCTGDYTISGGLSINHLEFNDRHIYFGTISKTHWNPSDDSMTPLDWDTFLITDAAGNIIQLELAESAGYLCILDAPLSDFQVVSQSGTVCLTFDTYLAQGYPIRECTLTPVTEQPLLPE